jgi:serine protease inhibitor
MMNSTYFSCLWESHNGFDPAKTKEANFTLHGGRTVRVPMMRNTRMYCSFSTSFLTRTTICALYFEVGLTFDYIHIT